MANVPIAWHSMPGVREKPDPDSSLNNKNRLLFRTTAIGEKISQYRTGLNSECNKLKTGIYSLGEK